MLNYESLGPTPAGEDCVPVGDANYSNKAGAECSRYRDLLKLKFPEAGKYGCSFHRKSFQHEFGTYYEIVVQFDDSEEKQWNTLTLLRQTFLSIGEIQMFLTSPLT